MSIVAIIDYGVGNLDSVARAVELCGGKALITRNTTDIEAATHIVLPGVGSFPEGMDKIRTLSLFEPLTEQVIEKQIPILGICLGMQLMASKGYEGGETDGLGWIEADVMRFDSETSDIRIPHIGWNNVVNERQSKLFEGIPSGCDFYFVHSYHMVCKNEEDVLSTTPYGTKFVSAVGKNNIFGVQFHPEKSQRFGLQLIRNFLAI